MKKILSFMVVTVLLVCMSVLCHAEKQKENVLLLKDGEITLNGTVLNEGEEGKVTLTRDIIYYEDKDTYESGNVYGEGKDKDKFSAEEAKENIVITIREAGTYRVSGSLSKGQIAVDLGKDAVTDSKAVVNLILDNVDITCTVAPVINIYNVYECDTAYIEDADNYKANSVQNTKKAGINLILADDSVNNVHGAYVAKIFKDTPDQKKLHKYDGAIQSRQSMNVDGEKKGNGVLNLIADNEGMGSNMHLTVNGGKINIKSQDDGVNVNEDGISVLTVNGGALHIVAGLGAEGDGVDSNGYLVINGGVVIAIAKPMADSGLDSDMGSFVNGGYVVATGSPMDWTESDSKQVTMNVQFAERQDAADAIIVTDTDGKVLFAYDPEKDETTAENKRGYQGAVISSPEFKVGENYYLYVGGDVAGADTDGLYTKESATGFEGAVQQQFTGTDLRGHGMRPGGGKGFQPPEGFEKGERPEWNKGQGNRPGGERPPFEFPEMPEGERPPFDFENMPENFKPPVWDKEDTESNVVASVNFWMGDKVNRFSGVSDASEDAINASKQEDNKKMPFRDVKKEDWHYNDVEESFVNGLMTGVSENEFKPEGKLTRAMLWTVLARLNGTEPTDTKGPFWYSAVQSYVIEQNLSDGTEPEGEITREQLATMLWRLAGCPEAKSEMAEFSDASEIESYATDAMQWAVEQGIIKGDNGKLKGKSGATRGETSAMINRFRKLYK